MLIITDLNNNSEPLIDYTDLKRTRRINSEKTISFTTFPSEKNGDAIHLVDVESKVEFDGDVYVIKSCEVVADGDSYYKVVSATMKFYVDLIGKQQPLIKNGSLTFVDALNFVFDGTDYTYTINGTFYAQEFENLGNTNRLALLSTIIDRYKAEFIVVNNNAFFYEQVGTETDIAFRYAKNITGLNRPSNSNDLATIITGTGANIGTEESPNYITATYTSPNIEKFGPIEADPIHDERFTTVESLTNHLKEILQDEPVISLQVNIAVLEEQEIRDLDEGDYIYLIYEPFDDLEVYVRVVELDEYFDVNGDLVDADITLANYQESLAATFIDSIDVKLSEERKVITNIIQQTADGKNSIFRGPTEPQGDNLKEGDLWYQPTGDGETRMYQYTGTHWELILDTSKTTEIANKVDEAFQDAQSAIDAAANAQARAEQANQEAEQALIQAQTSFDTAQNALLQSNQAITEADNAFARANDAFENIGALSIRVDEQSGEISTIKQSVSGLQTKISNAEGNISTLTQTTQGLQTRVVDAEGNISKLTQTATLLDSKITNLKVGGRNLVKVSNKILGWTSWYITSSLSADTFNDGSEGIRIKMNDVITNPRIRLVQAYDSTFNNYTNLVGGQTYTFSFIVKGSEDLGTLEFLGYRKESDGSLGWVDFPKVRLIDLPYYDENEGSRIYTYTFKATETVKVRFSAGFGLSNSVTNNSWATFGRIKVEEGNVQTDWSPAPEDIDKKFVEVSSQISQTADSINANIKAVDGRVTALSVSLNGIATRVNDAEGNISTLTQTTSGLQTRVANAEGNISTLTQTASALQTRMSNAEGNISTLTQTATSLTSRIDNLQVGDRNFLPNSKYLEIDNSNSTNPNRYVILCTLENNTTYTFSTISKLVTGTATQFSVLVYKRLQNTTYKRFVLDISSKRQFCTFTTPDDSIEYSLLIYAGVNGSTAGNHLIFEYLQLGKGNMQTDWSPAPEDTDSEFASVYSQITQLNNNINLKVSKNDVVNQINVSTEGILIDGSKVHITGTTTIDNGVIKSAMIASLSADKITTGTLNAANVNVINLNASSIVSGTLNANNVTFGNSKIKADSTGLYVYKNSVLGASLVEGNLSFYNQTTGALIGRFAATVWENTSYTGISMNVEHDKYISFGHYVDSTVGYLSMLTIAPTAFAGVPKGINTGLDLRLGGDLWAGAWGVRFGRNNTHNHSTIWHVDDNLAIGSYGMLRLGTFTSGAVLNDRFTISSTVLDAYRDLDMHGWKLLRVGEIQTSNWARLAAVSNMGYLQHDYGISITKFQSTTYAPIAASAFNVGSSREFKTNIQELDYSALSIINALTVVEYDLIANLEDGIDDRQVGLIAEDSLSVATKDGKAINTYKLTAYNTKAIQEISAIQQDELLTRAQLELKISTLESEVAKLKEKLGAA